MSPEDLQGQLSRSAAVERELREEIGKLRAELVEAKTAAARTCYQGGAAAGEVLAKMQAEHARLEEERSELRKLLRDLRQGAIEHGQHRNAKAARQEADGGRCCCVGCITVRVVDAVEARWPESDNAASQQPNAFQTAALAACTYLEAQAALAAAGTSPERPDAARRLAEAWIALTGACKAIQPVVGPAQDGAGAALPRSGIPLIDHDYVPTPHPAVDACDKRVSDNPDGRPSRQCGRPRREHQSPEGGK